MRRIDKELFKIFRETSVIEIYNGASGCSVDKLAMMLHEVRSMDFSPRVKLFCEAALLKALDQASGREKALGHA